MDRCTKCCDITEVAFKSDVNSLPYNRILDFSESKTLQKKTIDFRTI